MPALAARSLAATAPPGALGLVIHSFAVRGGLTGFGDPIRFLESCGKLGAAGVQIGIGTRDDAYADVLRTRVAAAGMRLEGIALLPRDEADVARFEAEVRTARRAGATIVRTVTLTGRRYETFESLATFRKFAERTAHSLELAAPVIVRQGIRLAVENHKDWRANELLALIKGIGCDHLGVCLDTGNSIALLEDPMEVIEALAPLALTTHFKDMAVEPDRDGFRLAEVPLGTGILDLPRVVSTLRRANPEIPFNLEMITRDPLLIPCLTERYWTTLPDLPGRHLAHTMALVRSHPAKAALPRISGLAHSEQLAAEDNNIQLCLDYARDHLVL